MTENNYKCPVCHGDGIKRCDNPDHGLLTALTFRGTDQEPCPVCGHDKLHRIKNGNVWVKCQYCEGTGIINRGDYDL